MNDHHSFVARFHAQAQSRARQEAEAQTRIAVNLMRDAVEAGKVIAAIEAANVIAQTGQT